MSHRTISYVLIVIVRATPFRYYEGRRGGQRHENSQEKNTFFRRPRYIVQKMESVFDQRYIKAPSFNAIIASELQKLVALWK